MRAISEDLDRQLNEIMASQALSYSTVNTVGLPYNATTKFNPKGMGQLYNVTNMFIDLVQSKQAYPEGKCLFCISAVEAPSVSAAKRYGGFSGLERQAQNFRPASMVTPCYKRCYASKKWPAAC